MSREALIDSIVLRVVPGMIARARREGLDFILSSFPRKGALVSCVRQEWRAEMARIGDRRSAEEIMATVEKVAA